MTFESFHHTTLGELLTAQASRFADRPFLIFGDERWSYAEAERQATAAATGLRGLGLQAGDRVAVILPNIPQYVIAVFAVAKAGLILNPINVRRHKSEVLLRMAKTRPAAVIADTEHLPMLKELQLELPELKHLIAVDDGAWRDLVNTPPIPVEPSPQPNQVAAILYTLGNSGNPRGATLTHEALMRNAVNNATALAATPDDVFLGAVPFSNSFGLTPTILSCVVAGAQLAPLAVYNPGEALALIERAKVTVHHGVPTMFALELNHPDFKPERCATLRTGIMSGAACPPELVSRVREQMNCNLLVAYGLTEAAPGVT
ncbi:MAG: class I adenylate-forming enzyme family protein, partial [Chloroflexota bacterium]